MSNRERRIAWLTGSVVTAPDGSETEITREMAEAMVDSPPPPALLGDEDCMTYDRERDARRLTEWEGR